MSMCGMCTNWDYQSRGCMIHNTVPGGCKDFRERYPMKSCVQASGEILEDYATALTRSMQNSAPAPLLDMCFGRLTPIISDSE